MYPQFHEVYTAIRGQGSFMNGKKIEVSQAVHLKRVIISHRFLAKILRFCASRWKFCKVIKAISGIRRPGAAAYDLCMVARGSLDAFWEQNLRGLGYMCRSIACRRRGGQCSTYQGEVYTPFEKPWFASNGENSSGTAFYDSK